MYSKKCFSLRGGLLLFIFSSLCLTSLATAADALPKEPLPLNVFKHLQAREKQTVVLYGTSLTAGGEWAKAVKNYFDREFPGLVTFVNAAQSGQESNWAVTNLQKRVLARNPDLVLIEFSVNDAATRHAISLQKSEANLDAMVKAMRQQNPQVDIVVLTMNPAWNSPDEPSHKKYASDRPHLAEYYDVYRKYAREHTLPLVDIYPLWDKLRQGDEAKFKKWLPEGLHPIPAASLTVTWPAIEQLLEKARAATSFSVKDFGAAGDGKTSDTAAIQKALDSAARAGGGEVRLPEGRYISGSLVLKSHTTLRLETNAVLLSSADPNDYPIIRARWEGIETNCHRALISADHAEDIAVTGSGTVEVSGAVGRLRGPRGPTVIEAIECGNVRVEGLTLKSTRIWTLHPAYCHDVVVRGVTFETSSANSDGIDPDSCQRVLIDGCTFTTGDDNIAIKSGKGQEGVRIGRPCEDITITNCTFIKGYTSIAFGSELSGGIRRVHISNCTFQQGRAALQLKSRGGRGGYLEDVIAEHLVVGPEPLLEITGNYSYNEDAQGVPGEDGLTQFSNIQISDVKIASKNLLTIDGPAGKAVNQVRISDVRGSCNRASVIQNAKNVFLTGIQIEGISGPQYFTNNVTLTELKDAAPLQESTAEKH